MYIAHRWLPEESLVLSIELARTFVLGLVAALDERVLVLHDLPPPVPPDDYESSDRPPGSMLDSVGCREGSTQTHYRSNRNVRRGKPDIHLPLCRPPYVWQL